MPQSTLTAQQAGRQTGRAPQKASICIDYHRCSGAMKILHLPEQHAISSRPKLVVVFSSLRMGIVNAQIHLPETPLAATDRSVAACAHRVGIPGLSCRPICRLPLRIPRSMSCTEGASTIKDFRVRSLQILLETAP
jgi:hypothetical protein